MNVLITIVDALRADHLSCYGYERPTSPNLDALASDPAAVRFGQAFSPSTWTKPVAASILSGCFPPAHGVRTRSDLFTRSVPRLAELLSSVGYHSAAVSTIGNVSSSLGFARGFDEFVDLYKDPVLARRREVSNTGAWKLYFEEDTTVVLPLAEDVNALALPWLDEAAARAAEAEFDNVFAAGQLPSDMPVVHVSSAEPAWIVAVITACEFAKSNGEARRLIKQGAVSLDGERITDEQATVPSDGAARVLKVGKRRFASVTVGC